MAVLSLTDGGTALGTLLGAVLMGTHLAAMNVASAGPLVCAWAVQRGGEGALRLARRVAAGSLGALALGSALGGGLLLEAREGLRAALARFPASAYWFAGAELVFSAACLAGLLLLMRGGRRRPVWVRLVALASVTNLLYHFPPLMAIIGKLAGDARWAADAMIERRALLRLAARPEVLALWLHFVLASITGAAVFALWPARGEAPNGPDDDRVMSRLAGAALAASLLQLPVGAWVLLASRARTQEALLGDDATATACFALGVLLAVGLLQSLAAVTFGDAAPATRRRVGWLFLAVAVMMSATLTASRAG